VPDGLLIFIAGISILPILYAADRARTWWADFMLDLEHRRLTDEAQQETW